MRTTCHNYKITDDDMWMILKSLDNTLKSNPQAYCKKKGGGVMRYRSEDVSGFVQWYIHVSWRPVKFPKLFIYLITWYLQHDVRSLPVNTNGWRKQQFTLLRSDFSLVTPSPWQRSKRHPQSKAVWQESESSRINAIYFSPKHKIIINEHLWTSVLLIVQ